MDNYRKPPRVNRYWKRPKPKVYDCNVRDAERFYQENYKSYLSEKEDAANRAARGRSIDTSFQTEFYPHLLAGNVRRDTSARTNLDLAPLPPSLSDSTRARLEAELSSARADELPSFTARSGGLPDYDPIRENSTVDERLGRLKKLRDELGLPSEPQVGGASHTFRSESLGRSVASAGAGTGTGTGVSGRSSDLDSYKSERTTRSRVDTGPEESSSFSLRSERSARVNGTAGPNDDYNFKSDSSSSGYKLRTEASSNGYNFRSERSTDDKDTSDYKFKSDLKTDDYKVGGGRSLDLDMPSRSERLQRNMSPKMERLQRNLSPKTERKRDDYSFSSSATEKKSDRFSAMSSGSTAASKKVGQGLDDDDDSLAKVMKKMPSSQEILERISKMELDD